MAKTRVEKFDSVWDALAASPDEAANLKLRAQLMTALAKIIADNAWTQAEAAAQCGITQPRINDLLRGKISKFSLDALVVIASALGRRVDLRLRAA